MAIKKIKIAGTSYDINDSRSVVIGNNAYNLVALTTAQYNTLATKDPQTLYVITDGDPGDGSSVSWGTESGYTVPLTINGTTKIVCLNGYSAGGSGGGDTNVIETVKVNGTALTPDAQKAVNVKVPIKVVAVHVSDVYNIEDVTDIGQSLAQEIIQFAASGPVVILFFSTNPSSDPFGDWQNTKYFISSDVDLVSGEAVFVYTYEGGFECFTLFSNGAIDEYESVGLEDARNKVTSISSSSTNTQYPSAKLLYDQLALKQNKSVIYNVFSDYPDSNVLSNLWSEGVPVYAYYSNYDRLYFLVSYNSQNDYAVFASLDNSLTLYTFNYNGHDLDWESLDYPLATTNLIPTESTVSGWGFTKNTGTYSKPSGGIPATDLASAVQTSLGKADTALQSYTETDPVFTASAAHGISSTDISNWNSKQSAITISSSEPTSSQGSNGDIWIVV